MVEIGRCVALCGTAYRPRARSFRSAWTNGELLVSNPRRLVCGALRTCVAPGASSVSDWPSSTVPRRSLTQSTFETGRSFIGRGKGQERWALHLRLEEWGAGAFVGGWGRHDCGPRYEGLARRLAMIRSRRGRGRIVGARPGLCDCEGGHRLDAVLVVR